MDTIEIEPLTAQAFAPFGDVVSAGLREGAEANQGTAVRFDWAARLESDRPHARPNLAVFRAAPQPVPFVLRLLERHPHSSQAFLPLKCARFLVCVAPTLPDGGPDVSRLRAFVGVEGQGVNYVRGTWHHPIVALDGPADLAMLAWEDGTKGDCEERRLELPITVRFR